MVIQSPAPLDRQISSLIADLRATQAEHRALAILHALITACLIRILTRLEALVTLWQAGHLPPPVAPIMRAARTPTPENPPRATVRRTSARTRREPAPPGTRPLASAPLPEARHAASAPLPRAALRAAMPRTQASCRVTPPASFFRPPLAPCRTTPILLRYHNE
jgi:hypothetical protein